VALMAEHAHPAEGTKVTFNGDHGRGMGMIAAGTRAEVYGVFPPGSPGIGDDGTHTVMLLVHEPPFGDRFVALPIELYHGLCDALSDPVPAETDDQTREEAPQPAVKARRKKADSGG
jgi:hypothetical protein